MTTHELEHQIYNTSDLSTVLKSFLSDLLIDSWTNPNSTETFPKMNEYQWEIQGKRLIVNTQGVEKIPTTILSAREPKIYLKDAHFGFVPPNTAMMTTRVLLDAFAAMHKKVIIVKTSGGVVMWSGAHSHVSPRCGVPFEDQVEFQILKENPHIVFYTHNQHKKNGSMFSEHTLPPQAEAGKRSGEIVLYTQDPLADMILKRLKQNCIAYD